MQCDTCHAGCCRAYNLFITIADALRISRDLHLNSKEFTDFKTFDEAQTVEFEKRSKGILFNDPGSENKRFFLTLKRVESHLIPGTIRCIFLNEWERSDKIIERGDHPGAYVAARCGIYSSRPLMCRSYPSTTDSAGYISYIRKPPTSSLTPTHEIYKLCPEDWAPEEFSQNSDDVVHNHAVDQYEWSFQRMIIEKWNNHPKAMDDFFPLMEKVYQRRLAAPGSRLSELFETK